MDTRLLVNGLALLLISAVGLGFAAFMVNVVADRPFEALPIAFPQDFLEVAVFALFIVPLVAALGALVMLFRAWR